MEQHQNRNNVDTQQSSLTMKRLGLLGVLIMHGGLAFFGLNLFAVTALGAMSNVRQPDWMYSGSLGLVGVSLICAVLAIVGYGFGRKSLYIPVIVIPPVWAALYILVLSIVRS